jgi:hypothetical protein
MHAIRNRALRRVLDSVLLAELARTNAAQARSLARRQRRYARAATDGVEPPRRARLRLVKS